jgi:hypothetical protein
MTCSAFEAVLKQPESDASNAQLRDLIAAGDYSGSGILSVAETYLKAFINSESSRIRRRWAGIALSEMLGESPEVVNHLKLEKRKLQRLGDILLSNSEREDTKIVAGMVMRQGLELGIEFACFWSSDKVENSAPNFPKEAGPRWIKAFQSFLDSLSGLALADPVADPCILFPVAVVASDGFKWASANGGVPVAIVEASSLTVLLSDEFRHDVQFLDIPLAQVSGVNARPSASLHDSQSRKTTHEPWDLALDLHGWSYLLNGTKRAGNEVTILFNRAADAQECEAAIKELRNKATQRSSPHPRMSRSPLIDISSSPPPSSTLSPKNAGLEVPAEPSQSPVPAVSVIKQPAPDAARRSSPRKSSQLREQPPHHAQTEEISADPLGYIPSAVDKTSQPTSAPNRVDHAKAHATTAATSKSSQSKRTKPARTTHTQEGDVRKETPTLVRPTRNTRAKSASQSTQATDAPDPVGSPTSPTAGAVPGSAASKRVTYSKGKLQKVSQAIKQRASQHLREQTDVFEIPDVPSSEDTSQATSVVPTQVRNGKDVPRRSSGAAQGRQTRRKRKSEEDNDFVPTVARPTTRATAKRKSASSNSNASQPPKKKAKGDLQLVDQPVSDNVGPSSSNNAARKAGNDTKEQRAKLRRSKASPTAKSSAMVALTRTPLIGRLTGADTSAPTSKATFKKPAIPSRAINPSSTPTRRQVQASLPANEPHTPKLPSDPAPHMPSSPPGYNMIEEDAIPAHRSTAETEVLSSNSKPLPASPNADSTAISGHADFDDMDIEKQRGDLQTARSDPFTHRVVTTKTTSFTRRLTGDDIQDDTNPVGCPPVVTALEIDESTCSDTESLLGKATVRPRSQPRRRQLLEQPKATANLSMSLPVARNDASKTVARMEERSVVVTHVSQLHEPVERTSQTTQRKPAVTLPASRSALEQRELSQQHRQSNSVGDKAARAKTEETRGKQMTLAPSPQDIDEAQVDAADEAEDHGNMDEDTTLVNDDSDEHLPTQLKATPVKIRSSPPRPPSSHSSTSAESDPKSPPRVPTSDAEEIEWEMSLEPHQRDLHDLLLRVSKRVTRHVVDNETAVTDIAEIFANDGEHLLSGIVERQGSAFLGAWEDMETKKATMKQEMAVSMKALMKERKRLSALT